MTAVVLEVDGSADALHVVDFATVEAQRAGTGLTLVRPFQTSAGVRRTDADRELRVALGHVRRQVGYDLPVRSIAREGSRCEVLAQLSRTASQVVVARRRVRGPQRLLAAQEDLGFAMACHAPLTVVPRGWKPDSTHTAVVVGVDGTARSWEAVGQAFAAAGRCGSRLIVVHGPGVTLTETLAGWQESYPGVAVERWLSKEPVSLALARWSARAGLLVLGVRSGRNAAVASETLAAANCAVTLVRRHWIRTEVAASAERASCSA